MQDNTVNRIKSKWLRPWNITQFDDLYNRDERFFSIIIKGVMGYLTRNIKMYNEPILHFIFNTGSSYMYVESNGYEFNLNETTGEDYMYMHLPRCVIEIGDINIATEELTQSFARGSYERKQDNIITGFNAEIKRIPLEVNLNLHYVLSNFNESIILVQELIDKLTFQKYFKINYLGNIIHCSIELPQNYTIQFNKIDLASTEVNQKTIDISLKVCTNYPIINEDSEIPSSQVISKFGGFVHPGKRSDNVIITIDGVDMTENDIFIDLRKFDFNKDGILDEREIAIVESFLETFDLDKDEIVTDHDISIVEESFINKEYNIKFDILQKGQFDETNLYTIKELFKVLDLNKDSVVSKYELQLVINIIRHLTLFDFNRDLIIDYNDIHLLIDYVSKFRGKTLKELFDEIIDFIKEFIGDQDLIQLVKDSIKSPDLVEIVNFYLEQHNIILDEYILLKLLELLKGIIEFNKYDLNQDEIIDENDIQKFVDELSDSIHKEIKYFVSSSIIIHQKDHSLSNDSITDTVEITKELN